MNNRTKETDVEFENIDAQLEMSLAEVRSTNTLALQDRILARTANLPQNRRFSISIVDLWNRALKASTAAPKLVMTTAFTVTLATIILMWWPNAYETKDSIYQAEQITEEPRLSPNEEQFGVLSQQEVDSEAYGELVWEEVLLTEDELVFASL